jgi:hypothetical protein
VLTYHQIRDWRPADSPVVLDKPHWLSRAQVRHWIGPMDPTGPQWTIRRIMVTPTWTRTTLLSRITHSF